MKLNSQKIIIGVSSVIIVGVTLWWFVNSKGQTNNNSAVIVSTENTPETVSIDLGKDASEILAAVNILENLNLDTGFLDDPRFTALKTTPIDIELQRPVPRTFELSPNTPKEQTVVTPRRR